MDEALQRRTDTPVPVNNFEANRVLREARANGFKIEFGLSGLDYFEREALKRTVACVGAHGGGRPLTLGRCMSQGNITEDLSKLQTIRATS